MNDFVLRGFCQKCENSFGFHDQKKGYTCYNDTLENYIAHDIVWFLSPKQIVVVSSDSYYRDFWGKIPDDYRMTDEEILAQFIETKTFLVAKILSNEEKKQKEGK